MNTMKPLSLCLIIIFCINNNSLWAQTNYLSKFQSTTTVPNLTPSSLLDDGLGNIMIGTAVPTSIFTLKTNPSVHGFSQTDGTITLSTYVGPYLGITGGWLGTKSNHDLHFFTNNGGALMTITVNGNVGVQTTTPSERFQVDDGNILVKGTNNYSVANDAATLFLGNNSQSLRSVKGSSIILGNSISPNGFTILEANNLMGINMIPNYATIAGGSEKLQVNGSGRFLPVGQPSSANGTRIGHDGINGMIDNYGGSLLINYYSGNDVSIGTGNSGNSPGDLFVGGNTSVYKDLIVGHGIVSTYNSVAGSGYNIHAKVDNNLTKALAVTHTGTNVENFIVFGDGTVLARELKIMAGTLVHPDYVFQEKYPLLSLNDLEQFVQTHKHLPNIPSAKEVQEAGSLSVGEMQTKLLEKIEELTLYVLQLKRANDLLNIEVNKLKK